MTAVGPEDKRRAGLALHNVLFFPRTVCTSDPDATPTDVRSRPKAQRGATSSTMKRCQGAIIVERLLSSDETLGRIETEHIVNDWQPEVSI